MQLEYFDAVLFFQLWFPLLDFVNRKHRVLPGRKTIAQRMGTNNRDLKTVADYLWSHTDVIDEYLATNMLPDEYAQIVSGWKQRKQGRFILTRHLDTGSVFISEEDSEVYLVKGLFSTWGEMLGRPPVMLDAVLIPFLGSIISDGLVIAHQMDFDREAVEGFRKVYRNAKENNAIHMSITHR